MFTSEAETILGMSAQEIGDSIENNPEAAASIVERVNFKQFIFKCRAKMETYNVRFFFSLKSMIFTYSTFCFQDEARLKTIAVEVKPIDYKVLNNQIIKRINQLMA